MGLLDRVNKQEQKPTTDTLNKTELSFLLKVLHDCKFDGKDVLLLADVVHKLKNQLDAK